MHFFVAVRSVDVQNLPVTIGGVHTLAKDDHRRRRLGPGFAFAVLDTAISQTTAETHLTGALLTVLGVGILAMLSSGAHSRRTVLSSRATSVLALATILSIGSLVVGRLGGGIAQASGGGYSYLVLATILPLGGILIAHLARSRGSWGQRVCSWV